MLSERVSQYKKSSLRMKKPLFVTDKEKAALSGLL